jgi:hypothetical protein
MNAGNMPKLAEASVEREEVRCPVGRSIALLMFQKHELCGIEPSRVGRMPEETGSWCVDKRFSRPARFQARLELAPVRSGVERAQGKSKNHTEDPVEQVPGENQADHSEALGAKPVEESAGGVLGHDERDGGIAIEWWHGQKIKSAEEEIENEDDAEERGSEPGEAGHRGDDHASEAGRNRSLEDTSDHAGMNGERRKDNEGEVCGRSGQGHPRGAVRMPLLPQGVVRGAGPANHPVRHKVGNDGNEDESNRRAADVRNRVERDLAAFEGCRVAAELGCEGVCAFVARG